MVAKLVVCCFHAVALAVFLGATAFAAGYILFGRGALTFVDVPAGLADVKEAFSMPIIAEGEAVKRLALAYLFMGAGMAAVASLAVFLSALSSHSLTATGATVGILLICAILGTLGLAGESGGAEKLAFLAFFAEIRPYLLTSHTGVYDEFLAGPIDWERVRTSSEWLAGYTAVFGLGAIALFRRREILC